MNRIDRFFITMLLCGIFIVSVFLLGSAKGYNEGRKKNVMVEDILRDRVLELKTQIKNLKSISPKKRNCYYEGGC